MLAKKILGLGIVVASFASIGCGVDSNTTPEQDAAFKKGDKSAIKPPPAGANSAPSDFKSSLSGPSPSTSGGQ